MKNRELSWATLMLSAAPLLAVALSSVAILSSGPACAATPAPSAAPRSDYTFAFQNADVRQVAQEVLGEALRLSYNIDPQVSGTMSFRIDRRLSRAQLLEALEAALEANGVTLVRDGESVTLVPLSKAKSSLSIRRPGEGAASAGYSVVAFPLAYATPSEVAKALNAMGRQDLVLYTDDALGLLVLGGNARELGAAQETLHVLDQSALQGARIRWFELSHVSARTLAQELQRILVAAGANGVTAVPLARLNGLLVFGRTPQSIDDVAAIVDRLDKPSKDGDRTMWFYRPVSLSADSIASTLKSVISGRSTDEGAIEDVPAASQGRAPAPPLLQPATSSSDNGSVKIGVNKDSNTLIISGSLSDWVQIQKILEQIDRPPGQVLIEASILEVTLTNEFRLGVDWSIVGAHDRLTATLSDNKAGTVAPVFPGLSVGYLDKTIDAAVNALDAVTDVEVVSAPKMIVLDNHTAKLQVGDQVPVTTQAAQSTVTNGAPLVVNTEYRDTGVILNVTPRISGDDEVVVEVDQQVSEVSRTTSSGIDSPTIQQRRLQGTLMLKDGDTAAFGGLISRSRTKTRSGVPFLTKVPLLGAAFKSTDDQGRRTELIVLMTAKIIRSPGDSMKVMADLQADMQEIQRRGLSHP